MAAPYHAQIRALIDAHGWMVQGVGAGDDGQPTYSYTIGLTEAAGPELVIVGLDPRTAQQILNTAARIAVDDHDAVLPVGDIDGIFSGFAARIVDLDDTSGLVQAHHYYADFAPVTARQLLWPDPEGRFPGEPGHQGGVEQQRIVA